MKSPHPIISAHEGFDEHAYLSAHPDVRQAVTDGQFASGAAHYEAFGRSEGRALKLRVVQTPQALDAEIDRLKALLSHSMADWMRARATFTYHEDISRLPTDPLSRAYRDAQVALYCEISGASDYDPWVAEPTTLSMEGALDPAPYPFNTGHGDLIAGHLLGISRIMQVLWGAKPSTAHTILEYGCGVGFTTALLAASGYRMTAVDINAEAIGVLNALAAGRRLQVRTHVGAFGEVPDEGERFDIILFYEAFHHCLDFVALLRKLHDRLAVGGILVFAGEPIYADFQKPWGLRLDGASLWEIRTRGWLELGFREDFFRHVLDQTGWQCEKFKSPGTPDIFVARPK
ncbi:MAG TPA: class I SAM-dependent methyltransferase [Caulobacteraceae bacterium]|nr:class I SAM-dependent methyltransferase [Caulobacteraceae bacterium]